MKQTSLHFSFGLSFWIVLLLATWLYFPGLQSNFILDDEINLQGLAEFDNPFSHDAMRFILEGESSSMGRPLSLVTFALQAYQWPNPAAFKYINLLIHLLNACLIFWVLLYLCRLMKLTEHQTLWVALCSTAIWVLHPFQVSTTLYVVQRMAQLGVFFIVLGLLGYLIGRTELTAQRHRTALLWMSFGVGLGGVLGILSKETAILLPLYILVIEFTLLSSLTRTKLWYFWASVFLFLPLLLLIGYFILSWPSMAEFYKLRDFTVVQRLMTETRVLWDYIQKIILPTPNSFSIFHDDWVMSTHLLHPISTLLSTLSLIALVGIALWKRKQWSVFAFAIFWFLAGHSLESSFLPLKLYFEHRNYLPLLGPVLAIVYIVVILLNTVSIQTRIKYVLRVLFLLWFMSLPLIAWMEIELWQRPLTQASLWAELKPTSAYAQSHYAVELNRIGQHEKALLVYQHMGETWTQDVSPYLLWLNVYCYKPELQAPDLELLEHRLRNTKGDEAFGVSLDILINDWENKVCPTLLDTAFLEDKIFQPILSNQALPQAFRNLVYHNYARFQAKQHNYVLAIQYADKALAIKEDIKAKIERIHWLLLLGQRQAAYTYIEHLLPQMNLRDYYLHSDYLKSLLVAISKLEKMQNTGEHHE